MSPPAVPPAALPRLVHLRFYLIVVVTIAITALCWWRWPPDGGFESASLAIASLCTTLCIPSTLLLINAHIQAWERPVLQLCVVRILLMVTLTLTLTLTLALTLVLTLILTTGGHGSHHE